MYFVNYSSSCLYDVEFFEELVLSVSFPFYFLSSCVSRAYFSVSSRAILSISLTELFNNAFSGSIFGASRIVE